MRLTKVHQRVVSRRKQRGFIFPWGGGSKSIDIGDIVPNAIRLRASASARLYRVNTSATTYQKISFRILIKRGQLGTNQCLYGGGRTGSGYAGDFFRFNTSDQLEFVFDDSVNSIGPYATSAVFRDPLKFFELVVAFDTTQAVQADRMKVWRNGERLTVSNGLALNANLYFGYMGASGAETIGCREAVHLPDQFFDGVIADFIKVPGQALTPDDFSRISLDTGARVPKNYAGTFGAAGVRLQFNNGTSLTTLGYDSSGNNNHWTLSNISLTAGATYDWMLDTPTNTFATLNRLNYYATGITLSNANLTYVGDGSGGASSGSFAFDIATSKLEWQVTVGSGPFGAIGICPETEYLGSASGATANQRWYYGNTGAKYIGSSSSAYAAAYTTGDVMKVRIDNGSVEFFKNGVSQGVAWTGLTGMWVPLIKHAATVTLHVDFGQQGFTPSSGYKRLCTADMPDVTGAALKPRKHFDVVTQLGNTTGRTVSGLLFSPGLVNSKNRAGSTNRRWGYIDVVRGVNKTLASELAAAEVTSQTDLLTAFTADGFTIGADAGFYGWNGFTDSYVHDCWNMGSSTVTNTAGSITSQVRANVEAGQSIVVRTGNNTVGATIGHGLAVPPGLIISFQLTAGASHRVWHKDLTAGNNLLLDSASAQTALTDRISAVSSTTYTVQPSGTGGGINSAVGYVEYCFTEIPGYSKIDSYIGNGSADGPFVYLGFAYRYLLVKRVDTADDWRVVDTARSPSNPQGQILYPNLSAAEVSPTWADSTALGVKIRSTDTAFNANGGTYIIYAVADITGKYSPAR